MVDLYLAEVDSYTFWELAEAMADDGFACCLNPSGCDYRHSPESEWEWVAPLIVVEE